MERPTRATVRLLLVLLLLTLGTSACAPRLTPPYRDYRVALADSSSASDETVLQALRIAVVEAGWTLAAPSAGGGVSTAPRPVASGVMSETTASIEVVPLGTRVVRVWVRAERRGLLGGRSRVFGLSPTLRAALAGLSEALAQRGFVAMGSPAERDRAAR